MKNKSIFTKFLYIIVFSLLSLSTSKASFQEDYLQNSHATRLNPTKIAGGSLKQENDSIYTLVTQYAPAYYFHASEQYFPCSIEYLMQNGTLYNKNTFPTPVKINPTQQDLSTNNSSDNWITVNPTQFNGYPSGGQWDDTAAPLYYAVNQYQDALQIHYLSLYAYQGAQTIRDLRPGTEFNCITQNVGVHQGDLERVVVTLLPSTSSPTTYTLLSVGYESHGDVLNYSPDQVEFSNSTHPVVGVALNGHGAHNMKMQQGEWMVEGELPAAVAVISIFNPNKDDNPNMKNHNPWNPSVFKQLGLDSTGQPIGDQLWSAYKGRLGFLVPYQLTSATYVDGGNLSFNDWNSVAGWDWVHFMIRGFDDSWGLGEGPTGPGSRDWVNYIDSTKSSFPIQFYGTRPIDNQSCEGSPALVNFNSSLYTVYLDGTGTGALYVSQYNGGDELIWENTNPISSMATFSEGVGLASFNSQICMALGRGWFGNIVAYTSSDGINWSSSSSNVISTTSTMLVPPSLAVFNNTLFAGCQSFSGSNITINSSVDGANWNTNNEYNISNQGCDGGVSMASYNGQLFIAYKDANGKCMYVSSSSNPDSSSNPSAKDSWTVSAVKDQNGDNQTTSGRPTLINYNNYLYLCYRDAGGPQLWFTKSNDGINWNNIQKIPGQSCSNYPAMCVIDDDLYIVYRDGNGGPQLYITKGFGS